MGKAMTIDSSLSKIRYIGNGVTTTFSIPFAYLTNNDGSAQLAVYVGDSDTPLVEGEDYTIVGLGQAVAIDDDVEFATYEERFDGGDVVFGVAPEQGVPVAVVRNVPQTQGVVFVEGEKFPAQDFENALDKLTMEVQEVKENLQRAIVLPPTSTEKPIEARDAILLARDEAKTAAENAFASEQASLASMETATLAAQEANLAKENAEISRDAILNDAGFQVVAADLQGENKIGYVADNLDGVAEKVDIADAAATAAQEAAQSAATAAQEAKDTIATETGNAITEINNVKDEAISTVNTTSATAVGEITDVKSSAVSEVGSVKDSAISGITSVATKATAEVNAAAASASASAIRSENSAVRAEEAEQRIMESGALPSQAGNEGKFLTTDGTEASWADVGGGLEIGDIGFAPLGIDEAQNKRRYLNGQVISQAQFVSFTNKIKSAIELYPNLATSETNWQAEVTNSPYGICGKFVIDDTLGTIRLPKYPDWSIREVGQAAVFGNGMALGFENPKGTAGLYNLGSNGNLIARTTAYGQATGVVGGTDLNSDSTIGITTDPTKSGMIADLVNANTEDKLQGKWFIQVATGTEESVDVLREIELNNPFSLLDYKWSEYEISNASWLLSNGQFNSGATYISVYNLLLEIYNGTVIKDGVSVKLSTEAYADTDFVISTADTTFRLPVKVKLASGNAVVGNGMTLGLTNGTVNAGLQNLYTVNAVSALANSAQYGAILPSEYNASGTVADGALGVTTDPLKSGIETSSSGLKLYFYVGETIQDANVIAASQVLTDIASLKGYAIGLPDYNAGVSITLPYTATFKGVVHLVTANNTGRLKINNIEVGGSYSGGGYESSFAAILDVGDVLSSSAAAIKATFFPLKGVN